MNLDYSFFKVSDGHSLAYKKWDRVENPQGVVILIHGMAEHIERYDDFANFLNSKGLIVYGADQRGHGKTSGKKGLFTYKQGYKRVITDQVEFFNFVQKNHDDLKISYVAHSMGSYIGRAILSLEVLPINKIILSGTGFEAGSKSVMAIILSSIISKIKGPGQDANLLDSMVNGPFAASVKNPVTSFDWLSRDHFEVSKYVNDSNCGFICTNKFYNDFFNIVNLTCSQKYIKKIDKELPILLYSGSEDPVGGKKAVNVKKLYDIYKTQGLNVEMKINQDGRHENLNEINKLEVYEEFATFLL